MSLNFFLDISISLLLIFIFIFIIKANLTKFIDYGLQIQMNFCSQYGDRITITNNLHHNYIIPILNAKIDSKILYLQYVHENWKMSLGCIHI